LETTQHRIVITIAPDKDAGRLIEKLVEQGIPTTKISSTGGFLRRGNATILSGVDADEVEQVITVVRRECQPRTEVIPVQTLPYSEPAFLPLHQVLEVRVGGAIVFVLPVNHFEKI
jgi:uncharacterized protein YaaQ